MNQATARRVSSIGVAILVAGALAGFPHARGAQSCAAVEVDGSWKRISTPLRAVSFAVDERGGVYVAGDRAVTTSSDGGCSWTEVLDLDDASVAALPLEERITAVVSTGGSLVVALTGPNVLVSEDRGHTWERASAGLDVPGDPVGLYAAPSGDVLYMLVRQEVADRSVGAAVPSQGVAVVASVVYRSADGGRTWTRGTEVGTSYRGPHGSEIEGGSAPGAAWDVAVDPADPDHLLAAARDGVFRSVDGGKRWTVATFAPGAQIRTVTLWRGADGRPAAVAVDPAAGAMYGAADAAGVWSKSSHPQLRTELMSSYPDAAAWAWSAATAKGDVLLSGPKGVFSLRGGTLTDVTGSGLGGRAATAADLQVAPGAGGPAPWGRLLDGSALVTRVPEQGSPAGSAGGNATGAGNLLEPVPAGIRVPRVDEGRVELVGETARVALAPGASTTVSYEARLDPRPTRVDLYFLVDTTSSMSDAIRALVESMEDVVRRLARSGIELRAGLGAFRTYPRESDRVDEDYAYRRIRPVGSVGADLVRALYELEGGGSSGANLTALYQAVTGAGQDVVPPGPSKADVAAGGGAGFDPRALKVVMHVADTWFGTPERGDPNGYYAPGAWPGPPSETVAAALRAAGVLHLGVALQPGEGGTVFADADVVEDMQTMSRATRSVAGERGADCDGDGRPDLAPGRPLVCRVERGAVAGGLASVVTGLVEALERRGDVRLAEAGASGLVRSITPEVHRDVDLRGPQKLTFDVTVACGLDDAGLTRAVSLDLVEAGERLASSDLRVTCGDLAAAAPLDPARRSPGAAALVPPIPVPPPPHPVPGPGPGSVTAPAPVQAPAPAQAPGGQPQGATVAQRQQQPQAAFAVAVQSVRAQTQMQHALVSTRARDPLHAARTWTAVGALSLLWAWGIATATATAVRRRRA